MRPFYEYFEVHSSLNEKQTKGMTWAGTIYYKPLVGKER
jgi:hypothetical protein